MSVEVVNESAIGVDDEALRRLARFVLDAMGVHPYAELSVLLVDVATMTVLHQRWMDEPGPTDVLAFPMDELGGGRDDMSDDRDDPEPTLLGDVVLCPEVAREQAVAVGHEPDDELALLCTHGILHLLGYDHGDADEEREMFGVQTRLLERWHSAARR